MAIQVGRLDISIKKAFPAFFRNGSFYLDLINEEGETQLPHP